MDVLQPPDAYSRIDGWGRVVLATDHGGGTTGRAGGVPAFGGRGERYRDAKEWSWLWSDYATEERGWRWRPGWGEPLNPTHWAPVPPVFELGKEGA